MKNMEDMFSDIVMDPTNVSNFTTPAQGNSFRLKRDKRSEPGLKRTREINDSSDDTFILDNDEIEALADVVNDAQSLTPPPSPRKKSFRKNMVELEMNVNVYFMITTTKILLILQR